MSLHQPVGDQKIIRAKTIRLHDTVRTRLRTPECGRGFNATRDRSQRQFNSLLLHPQHHPIRASAVDWSISLDNQRNCVRACEGALVASVALLSDEAFQLPLSHTKWQCLTHRCAPRGNWSKDSTVGWAWEPPSLKKTARYLGVF